MSLNFIIIILIVLVSIVIISILLEAHDIQIRIDYWNNQLYSNHSCDQLKSELSYQNQFFYKNYDNIKTITKYLAEKECGI